MNFFINHFFSNKLGYDIYKFFLFHKKFYQLNDFKQKGNLIIYNGYFPYDGLHNYCLLNNVDKNIFIENEINKIFNINKKFIKKINKIFFFILTLIMIP